MSYGSDYGEGYGQSEEPRGYGFNYGVSYGRVVGLSTPGYGRCYGINYGSHLDALGAGTFSFSGASAAEHAAPAEPVFPAQRAWYGPLPKFPALAVGEGTITFSGVAFAETYAEAETAGAFKLLGAAAAAFHPESRAAVSAAWTLTAKAEAEFIDTVALDNDFLLFAA